MLVEVCSDWNDEFFKRMIDFKMKIHKDIPTTFPESMSDYEKFFSATSPFKEDYEWLAFIVTNNNEVMSKAILCWRRNSHIGNLGFLDWVNHPESAKRLIDSVVSEAKKRGLSQLKTPIDLNMYVKYRIKLPNGGAPFWGEPIYPDYYHELFIKTGFQEMARWDTFELKIWDGIRDYFSKRKKLKNHSKDRPHPSKIRCVKMKEWESELKIMHALFNEAYKTMPEWEPISFSQFKLIYDDFKYIINPLYSYIVELDGRPVAFSINFTDPLMILSAVKGKNINNIEKLLLFFKLRSNLSTFLIAHVGKISGPNGEEIKGVQIQVSKRIQYIVTLMKKTLVTFQVKNSPSRRSFDEKNQRPYSQYVLYGMNLE